MIKEFRSWDYYLKRFEYWTINDLCNKILSPSAIEEWTQWTGQYDCEGVKVFEGDIMLAEDGKSVYVVQYHAFNAKFVGKLIKKQIIQTINLTCGYGKIIGNIYANPELLEETNNE